MKIVGVVLSAAVLVAAGLAAQCRGGMQDRAKQTVGAFVRTDSKGAIGSPDFHPSPERPVGWRGDGTGRYPGATPPKEWYVRYKNPPGFASQVSNPKSAPAKLERTTQFTLNEWIAIGPWPVSDKKQGLETAHLSDELTLTPSEGDKAPSTRSTDSGQAGSPRDASGQAGQVADKQWRRLPMQNGGVCLDEQFSGVAQGKGGNADPKQQKIVYAHTYIYSDTGGPAVLFFTHNDGWRLYLNGEGIVTNGGIYPSAVKCALKQGWNRLLLKSWGHGGGIDHNIAWGFSAWLRMLPATKNANGGNFERKNIVYQAPLPTQNIASCPLVVGDRIFITGDHYAAAFSKQDGRMLWYRTILLYDGEAQESKGDAALVEKYNAACAKVHELDGQYAGQYRDGAIPNAMQARYKELFKELDEIFGKLDSKHDNDMKAAAFQQLEPRSAVTPCSDGKYVYVWSQLAVAACFDLNGKPQWSTTVEHGGVAHHGWSAAPVIIDGKFICKQSKIWAFDIKTGAVLWNTRGSYSWGSMVHARAGAEDVLVEQDNVFHHAKDGQLFRGDKGCKNPQCNTMSSPIFFEGSRALSITDKIVLTDMGPSSIKHTTIPWPSVSYCGGVYGDSPISSPIWHDGYVYIFTQGGTLGIVDTRDKKVISYEHMDAHTCWGGRAGSTASPCFANGLLYFFDDSGNTFVREPGPKGKVIARNSIATLVTWAGPTTTNITPVFDGSRIYWRIGSELCCIGEK